MENKEFMTIEQEELYEIDGGGVVSGTATVIALASDLGASYAKKKGKNNLAGVLYGISGVSSTVALVSALF